MNTSKLLAATAATAALTLAPATAAFAYNAPGGVASVVVNDSDTSDCQVPITVDYDGDVTIVVTDSNGENVSGGQVSLDGPTDLVVDLGADCAGEYTIEVRDLDGAVLASVDVFAGESPANAGGDDTDGEVVTGGETTGNVGGLPATGSSNAMLIGGVAGAGLLAGGSVLLVRRRRATA